MDGGKNGLPKDRHLSSASELTKTWLIRFTNNLKSTLVGYFKYFILAKSSSTTLCNINRSLLSGIIKPNCSFI